MMKLWQTRAGKLARVLTMLALTGLLGGCLPPPPPGPTVTHVALLWLEHPQRASDRAQVLRAARSLRMVPGVTQVETGRELPALRPYAAKDFDLGVVITFRDRASLQRFESDPRHPAVMRRYLQPLIRYYEVYDLSGR